MALQKKINNLEDKVKSLEEQLSNCKVSGPKGTDVKVEDLYLIATPAKHSLKGHRSNVTCLSFHPQYTQLASSSEDGTVKLWEFETGEYERTLKGHTGIPIKQRRNCKLH